MFSYWLSSLHHKNKIPTVAVSFFGAEKKWSCLPPPLHLRKHQAKSHPSKVACNSDHEDMETHAATQEQLFPHIMVAPQMFMQNVMNVTAMPSILWCRCMASHSGNTKSFWRKLGDDQQHTQTPSFWGIDTSGQFWVRSYRVREPKGECQTCVYLRQQNSVWNM